MASFALVVALVTITPGLDTAALLAASNAAYDALRIAGAIYMVLIGLRLLRSALSRRAPLVEVPVPGREATLWAAFRTGFLTNLLNPKVGAFYVALLPQFIPADGSPVLAGILLGVVHNLEGIVWFGVIILGADAARRHPARRGVERSVEGITAVALIGFGVKLARTNAP